MRLLPPALSVSVGLALPCALPQVHAQDAVRLDDAEVTELVRHAYRFVAMYNVNHKIALRLGGWNTVDVDKDLKDHTMRDIARPNNDTLYVSIPLDLRADPMVLDLPAFDSDYASLMITGYDHYVQIPMSTRHGDFSEPTKLLVRPARSPWPDSGSIDGIDRTFEAASDFVSAVLRVMPHANEPQRFERIVAEMERVRAIPLAEFLGDAPRSAPEIDFPEVGATDFDVFGNNLFEVLQFAFDHTVFDPKDPIDRDLLAAFAPLGVVPGRPLDRSLAALADLSRFRTAAEKLASDELGQNTDPESKRRRMFSLFRTKGDISIDDLTHQSILGPIGMPSEEAIYPAISTNDGQPMNAMYDYVVRMSAEDLPPAGAFWSVTLYEQETGFFVPNDRKKYSVGRNAGMKLDEAGGIEIHVAAECPSGVPPENWLPIERGDVAIGLVLRVYEPDLETVRSGRWAAPVAKRIDAANPGR